MTRLARICGEIESCKIFCDVGCDHGYITEYVLNNNLCERAIITDISMPSLEKAEKLLETYIIQGKCFPYCTDGFTKIDTKIDTAVIAGMGGKEIISIINATENLPDKLILQPMKNQYELRKYISEKYKIIKDYTFSEGKRFYDLMVLTNGSDNLTEKELMFGRTNLLERGDAFLNKIKEQLKKIEKYLSTDINDKSRQQLEKRYFDYKELIN